VPPPGAPPTGAPPAYGGAGYGYGYTGYPPSTGTNGMAVASLVLGILWIYWIGSILALVFGYAGLNQIRQRGQAGRGLAIAGIILGWIGIAILVIGVIAVAAGTDSS